MSLERLIQREKTSPSLLCAHIILLEGRADGNTVLTKARKYTSQVPGASELWLVRLDAEDRYGSMDSVERAWSEARRSVSGPEAEILAVWQWGLQSTTRTAEAEVAIHTVRVTYTEYVMALSSAFCRLS